MSDVYPDLPIALRLILTIPITVASGERTFSKLKLIKSYIRSTMTEDRLNALAIISIENEIAKKLDFDKLIDDFASIKARRVKLLMTHQFYNIVQL